MASTDAVDAAAGSDAGPPTVSAEACRGRCAAKVEACGAPSAQAGTICRTICAAAITEGQAACLEARSCTDLVAAASQRATLGTICPVAEPASGETAGPISVPAEITIAAVIPAGYVVDHTNAGAMRSSLFNVAGPALVVPTLPAGHLPSVARRGELVVVSPPRNGCESAINVTLTATQVAVSTSGVDLLPETKCADFIDAVAEHGVTLTLRDVPWDGSAERSTVTVVLRRSAAN